MINGQLWAAMMLSAEAVSPTEQPVDPYPQSDANAAAQPFKGNATWHAFHEAGGVSRVVDETVALSQSDPRISDIFQNRDQVRLRRTLKGQFCYIQNGDCNYTRPDHAGHAQEHEDSGR